MDKYNDTDPLYAESITTVTPDVSIPSVWVGEDPPKRRRSPKVSNYDQKVERIVAWINSGLSRDDIFSELSAWMDNKKQINFLLDKAYEEIRKPKPVEDRLRGIERQIVEILGRLDRADESQDGVQQTLAELNKTLRSALNAVR